MIPALSALVEAGLIPLAEAEQIDRSLDPVAARAHAEQLLTDAFARGLTAQQRRILNVLDSSQGQPTPANLARLWAQEDELLWLGVREDIIDVATEHAVRASINAADPNTWQLVNEEVVNWVDQRYTSPDPMDFGSIPNLNVTSRTQFADAFQRWQLGDRTPGNYAQGLPQLINELQPIFGRARAERIAISETTRVFSQSEIFAGNANPEIAGWVYSTANDSHVSEFCRGADGAVMLKGETAFSDGGTPPPRHVRCRSSISQVTKAALAALQAEGLVEGGPEVVAAERISVPRFGNVAEAQQYARDVLGVDADYTGASLEQAQAVNDGLADVQAMYPGPASKPGYIRFNPSLDATARQDIVGITINSNLATNEKLAESNIVDTPDDLLRKADRISRKIAQAKENPGLYTDEQVAFFETQVTDYKRLAASGGQIPWTYSKDIRDVIVHEIGHRVEVDLGLDTFPDVPDFLPPSMLRERGISFNNTLAARLDGIAAKEGHKLGEYARKNSQEYFAESFVAFVNNDYDKVHPDLIDIFRKITR